MKKYIIVALLATAAPVLQAISVKELIDQDKVIIRNSILDLSHMSITSLEGLQEIKDPKSVKTLILSHNKIAKLKEAYFENFSNVTYIDLSHNDLIQLTDDYFEDNKMLKKLNLAYNNISKITKDALNDLHSLAELDLSYNDLTQMASNLFHDTTKNIKVKLSGNPVYQQLRTLKERMPKIRFSR